MKIDGHTVVPIGWVITGLATIFTISTSVTLTVAFWCAAVNFRLQRIEDRLGIPLAVTRGQGNAYAADAKRGNHDDDTERLPDDVRDIFAHKRTKKDK